MLNPPLVTPDSSVKKTIPQTHLQRSKVNNIVNIRVLLKHLVQLLLVGNVASVVLGPLAADELDAVEDLVRRVVQVVDDDDLVVGLEQGEGGEGADVAGATERWKC